MNESKHKELVDMNWGKLTPEFSKENEIIHVFNHFLSTAESVERTIRFIVSRIQWYNLYLKNDFVHTVIIDDIGPNVSDKTYEHIRNDLKDYVVNLKFTSKEQ